MKRLLCIKNVLTPKDQSSLIKAQRKVHMSLSMRLIDVLGTRLRKELTPNLFFMGSRVNILNLLRPSIGMSCVSEFSSSTL